MDSNRLAVHAGVYLLFPLLQFAAFALSFGWTPYMHLLPLLSSFGQSNPFSGCDANY